MASTNIYSRTTFFNHPSLATISVLSEIPDQLRRKNSMLPPIWWNPIGLVIRIRTVRPDSVQTVWWSNVGKNYFNNRGLVGYHLCRNCGQATDGVLAACRLYKWRSATFVALQDASTINRVGSSILITDSWTWGNCRQLHEPQNHGSGQFLGFFKAQRTRHASNWWWKRAFSTDSKLGCS
jgi:hypothetical protein